jgi:hypothetical protein
LQGGRRVGTQPKVMVLHRVVTNRGGYGDVKGVAAGPVLLGADVSALGLAFTARVQRWACRASRAASWACSLRM